MIRRSRLRVVASFLSSLWLAALSVVMVLGANLSSPDPAYRVLPAAGIGAAIALYVGLAWSVRSRVSRGVTLVTRALAILLAAGTALLVLASAGGVLSGSLAKAAHGCGMPVLAAMSAVLIGIPTLIALAVVEFFVTSSQSRERFTAAAARP